MSDVPRQKPDTVLQRVLEWSKTRPAWQRDALRRIVLSGFLDEAAIDAILQLCKKEHGDQNITIEAEPFSEGDLPVDPGAGESVTLSVTQQRYRTRRRIFYILLKGCRYHRLGGSQLSGMILACFLGGRTPIMILRKPWRTPNSQHRSSTPLPAAFRLKSERSSLLLRH